MQLQGRHAGLLPNRTSPVAPRSRPTHAPASTFRLNAQHAALSGSAPSTSGRIRQRATHLLRSSKVETSGVGAGAAGGQRPKYDIKDQSLSSIDVEDLFGGKEWGDKMHSATTGDVNSVMRTLVEGMLTATPDETLQDIIPRLNKVTGLPVVSPGYQIMGVISRKDIIKVRNGKREGTMQDPVSKHMTSPAITVVNTASVQTAADLMMLHKIRRLPVVDENNAPVGIVSRSDIFKPLYREAYDLYLEKELAALAGGGSSGTSNVVRTKKGGLAVPWKIKYLYDGDCPMCMSLMNVLKRQDNGRGRIMFVNIADPDYNPRNHMGVTYEGAMETIHAIHPDGTLVQGTAALKELFETVGLGWAVWLSDLPIVSFLVDLLYKFLSANRLSMGGALDGIIAAKRMDLSKQGVETCTDVDDGCDAVW